MFVSGLIVQLVMYCRGEKQEENADKNPEKMNKKTKKRREVLVVAPQEIQLRRVKIPQILRLLQQNNNLKK